MNEAQRYCEVWQHFPGTAVQRFHALLLEHARVYEWAPLPKGVRYGRAKLCYMNAFRLRDGRDDLTYVEGIGASIIPVMHAWCVDRDGRVLDPTWRPGDRPTPVYFGIPMRWEWVVKATLRRGAYGVHGAWMQEPIETWREP